MFIKYIFNLLVILSLIVASFGKVFAVESILSTSVRKISSNALNFTFYTDNNVAEAPIVKDKGNNNYVILLPNLKDVSDGKPDLRAVADVVTDLNVKTIQEGAVTYTKVSLTTKVPVSVNVDTRKTSQSAKELSGVNDIIAKVNLINQDVQASKEVKPIVISQQNVNNFSSVKDVLSGQQANGAVKQVAEVKKEIQPKVPVKHSVSVNSVSAHVPSNTKTIKKETKKLQDENIKNIQSKAVQNINKIEENVKSSVQNSVTVNDDEEQFEDTIENVDLEPLPMLVDEKLPALKQKNNLLASPIALVAFFALFAGLFVLFIMKKMGSVLALDNDFGGAFVERMNSSVNSVKKDYSQIAKNQTLNWQEKYQSFKSGEIQEQKEALNSHIGADVDEDLDFVEGDIDDPEYEIEDVVEQEQINPFAANIDFLSKGFVVESGDVISASMRKTLTGFAEDKSLSTTKRNVGLKNRFTSFEKVNPELLQRNMQELLDTVIKIDESKPVVTSVDRVIEQADLSTPAISDIKPVKPSQIVENASSPIASSELISQEKKKLKIRQSRAIDDNKGFYLVDMNDSLALMGRINDKFTVLKKFDDMSKTTLQVRRDKENLYMVRTNGFKALVDVNEQKMGVLTEL